MPQGNISIYKTECWGRKGYPVRHETGGYKRGGTYITAGVPITNCLSFLTMKKFKNKTLNSLRKEGDSNPRYAFGVYTLSRRAS